MMSSPLHPAHVSAVQVAQSGNVAAARTAFAEADRAAPDDARFLTDYAAFASAIGEHPLAASLYARAIEATPGDAPPLRLRHALALMNAGALAQPIALLEALTHDHPGSPTAWQALGAARI